MHKILAFVLFFFLLTGCSDHEPLPVGKVYFDTIGLFLTNPVIHHESIIESAGRDEGESFGLIVERRIEELEQELAELKQLQLRKARSCIA